MGKKVFKIPVRVKTLGGSILKVAYPVIEEADTVGETIAIGKAIRYYDSLKDKKVIKDYYIMVE